ncbi:MAG: hypothetical protein COS82_08625 [Zetaproteobacteria bacterium CG06_land_8_20_14_3_00_59_53]|nr:MAG: hypothetical protein AUK36_06480 [Zetaproteobacteria bacterium CG2_30_59_37]PIO90686.1 MAG: hypothetical protein COX56_02795 [Zetaproteobacteria bacterium CG23_combo_of_CG06-09_8_20_14_all_59_86]PIQ66051.1 MAG: hypothetical protein COV97_00160 [Zetaproteobacteria bacterium CG11_big_fil_rev_8_21_14_0_20_59_439]PIU69991.1 MAG: hypothetical protein COS82_08625 [Zetaproteobacteria bacterium CG06_land_8_20_14_3_00_59_53]PIU97893.1 MAG: hypothetical protein COS62_02725 [Zetaproteobacteria bac
MPTGRGFGVAMPVSSLLVSLLLSACAGIQGKTAGMQADPPVCRDIPGFASPAQLCVSIDAGREETWFTRDSGSPGPRHTITGLSFTGNGQASFGDFSISPQGSWLAVTIAEEGHPSLLFRQLMPALRGEADAMQLPVVAIYPGGVSLDEWQDDHTLIIVSDQYLLHPHEHVLLDRERRYAVHLPDGALTLKAD